MSTIRFLPYELFKQIYTGKDTLTYGIKEFSSVFCTSNVMTCTAGGMIDRQKGILGFHFHDGDFDSQQMFKTIKNAIKDFKPENGLLVGGKNIDDIRAKKSLEQFQFLKELWTKLTKKVSLLEEHKNTSQFSNIHYSAKDDIWHIMTCQPEQIKTNNPFELKFKLQEVTDAESLKKFYRNISIAEGDRLFIGDKEITRITNPEFFT